MKRRVILVVDGDLTAKKAVEIAATNIGGRCISLSAGNPTPINGEAIVNLVKTAKYDPVLIMLDDQGHHSAGKGENALLEIANNDDIVVLGVVAVASNTKNVKGVEVDFSIDNKCNIVENAVNKDGVETKYKILYGDTVDIINYLTKKLLIVGVGDIGKMKGRDNHHIGAPVLTKALEEILRRN